MEWIFYIYYYAAEWLGFDPDPSDERNIDRNDWGDL